MPDDYQKEKNFTVPPTGPVPKSALLGQVPSKPKPAQTPTKVPRSPNLPPRGAAAVSASSQANWYSTRARASVGVQNLENSYRMPAQAARGEGATGLVGLAQRAVKGAAAAAAWVAKGLTATTLATGVALWGVSEGLFTRGTLSGADEAIAISRARQKQLGLTSPPESRQVDPGTPPPFTGGQGTTRYRVTWEAYVYNYPFTPYWQGFNFRLWGKIYGFHTGAGRHGIALFVRSHGQSENRSVDPVSIEVFTTGWNEPLVRNVVITREDGLPDTDGNPPPTTEPVYSVAAGISLAPYTPAVGEVESPPPALISQPGEFLYDGARAPLQRVLDGVQPPWKRQRSPQALESQPGDPLVRRCESAPAMGNGRYA